MAKLKAASIIEVVVAMLILSISLSAASILFAKVYGGDKHNTLYQCNEWINLDIQRLSAGEELFNNKQIIDNFEIEKRINFIKTKPKILEVNYQIKDQHRMTIFNRKRIITVNE